jgi:hypothetical protein
MIGDAIDFKARLRATLPVRWFPDTAPVLDALLGGLASAWASVYALLQYMRLMARISTAAGTTLDFIAGDYFGMTLVRRIGEADFFFSARIKAELLKPRATRAAVIAAVTRLTGVAPLVFEPSRPADTGAYNSAVSLGYGVAGGYGSYARQAQFYIVVTHGVLNGPPLVGGYYKGSGWAGGGYGIGALEYWSGASPGGVTDPDIFAAIAAVLPVGVTAWVAFSDGTQTGATGLGAFVLGINLLG